jgi:hypothetical protein
MTAMPTFETPEPIAVTVDIAVGEVRIVAGERVDSVVEVRPTNRAKRSDVKAAEQTRVDYSGGRLSVKGPKSWRSFSPFGGGESVDIDISVPVGSRLHGEAAVATFRCTGRLGECRLKTASGNVNVDETGPVQIKSSIGEIAVERVVGDADVSTSSGSVRIGSVDGSAVIKNSNGETWIGDITGELRVSSANGKIVVEHAHASVTAKTANGDIRLGDVTRGTLVAHTARGKVEVGIREGVAAWLDLGTSHGNVRSDLDASDRPADGEEALEVRARTAFGDITIRRAPTPSGV